MWTFNHHFWKQHNTEFQEVHACVLLSRKCDTTDIIVLLYHQCKEEFIRQTLEEKRAGGEIAGEVYASAWLQFSSLSPSLTESVFSPTYRGCKDIDSQ